MTMNNRIIAFFIIFVMMCGSFILILLFCGIYRFGLVRKNLNEDPQRKLYMYSKYNPYANSTEKSYVRLSQDLGENEFLYHWDQKREFFVVTNIADDEFECSGSCLCKSMERRTSIVAGRGVFITLSALSAILALKIAGTYFRNECIQKMSEECEEDDVSAEMYECHHLYHKNLEGVRLYDCNGHCVANGKIKDEYTKKKGDELSIDCTTFKREGIVELDESDWKGTIAHEHSIAVDKFRRQYLTNYCKEMSENEIVRDYMYSGKEYSPKNKPKIVKITKVVSFCAGVTYVNLGTTRSNNAWCVERR